jgi:signal transduction histidine kinase
MAHHQGAAGGSNVATVAGRPIGGAPLSPQDDLLLDGVARQVADVNRLFSKERLQRATAQDERQRLARELHDGVLQSLTGAALQLETLSRLIDKDPGAARQRLRAIEKLISEEQRELRTWIRALKPTSLESMASAATLGGALEALCRRIERQWSVRVELTVAGPGAVPRALGDEIYRIVQEALNNVGKHAGAKVARVYVAILFDRVCIAVTDDGRGFLFHGRYDLAALTAQQRGPSSLKERVFSLGGTFVLTSTPSGSHLEFVLPLHDKAMNSVRLAPDCY